MTNDQMIQEKLAQANLLIEEAKKISDETGRSFVFLGLTYLPRSVTLGHWAHEQPKLETAAWSESETWYSSNC